MPKRHTRRRREIPVEAQRKSAISLLRKSFGATGAAIVTMQSNLLLLQHLLCRATNPTRAGFEYVRVSETRSAIEWLHDHAKGNSLHGKLKLPGKIHASYMQEKIVVKLASTE